VVDKESGLYKEGGCDNGDNETNIEVDKESVPSIVGGWSFNEVDMESGPINDTVFKTKGVVEKESENVGQTINRDESENVGQTINRDESENVGTIEGRETKGREEDSEDDSAFGITFVDSEEEEVGLDDYCHTPNFDQGSPFNSCFMCVSKLFFILPLILFVRFLILFFHFFNARRVDILFFNFICILIFFLRSSRWYFNSQVLFAFSIVFTLVVLILNIICFFNRILTLVVLVF